MAPGTAALVIDALVNQHGFRKVAPDTYRGNTPWRDGSNSDAFTLSVEDDEHGAAFDHVTEEGFSLYQVAERIGMDVPSPTTKRAFGTLAVYAEAHHVTPGVFQAAGWQEATHYGRPALAFPTDNGTRWRFLDDKTPRFINPKGYARCWYGLKRAVAVARHNRQPLVLCNGEPSTVVAEHYGMAACCVTSGEKKEIPDSLLVELWEAWQGEILVVFDSDDTGRAAGRAVAGQLRENGWPETRAIDLQGGKEGYDLADFCGTHGTASAEKLLDMPLLHGEPDSFSLEQLNGHKQDAPAFRIYSIADMWEQQASLQKAWGGWMLLNNITLIGGVPSVGKSPLLMAMVAGYLRGRWPDGAAVPDIMRGRNVAYCLPEGYGEQTEIFLDWGFNREELAERLFMVAVPTPGAPEQPMYTFKLDQQRGLAALHYYCHETRPALVVIDGLRASMTGEESSSGDVDRYYAPLVQIASQYNACVIIAHHLTKGTETASREGVIPSIDWFRGSGHIVAVPRSAWIVDQPDPNTPELRRVTLVKAAAGPRYQMMAFTMADPADGVHFNSDIPQPPPRSKKEAARRFILQMLRRGRATHEALWHMAEEEEIDVSEATFRAARVELASEHRIVQQIRGRDYYWILPGPPGLEPDRMIDELLF